MSESVADHFAEQADSQPDAPALIWDGRAISYGTFGLTIATLILCLAAGRGRFANVQE